MSVRTLRPSAKLSIVAVIAFFSVGPVLGTKAPPFFTRLDFYSQTVVRDEYTLASPHLGEREKGILLHHSDGSSSRATHEDLNIPFSFTRARGGYKKLYELVDSLCTKDATKLFDAINRTLKLDPSSPKRVTGLEVFYRRFRKESLGDGHSRTVLVDSRIPLRCDAPAHVRKS